MPDYGSRCCRLDAAYQMRPYVDCLIVRLLRSDLEEVAGVLLPSAADEVHCSSIWRGSTRRTASAQLTSDRRCASARAAAALASLSDTGAGVGRATGRGGVGVS